MAIRTDRPLKTRLFPAGSTEKCELSVSDARDKFADVLHDVYVGNVRVYLTKHGDRVAALIPAEDLDLLQAIEDAQAEAELEQVRKAGHYTP
jgi:prevent-host-death family protein